MFTFDAMYTFHGKRILKYVEFNKKSYVIIIFGRISL